MKVFGATPGLVGGSQVGLLGFGDCGVEKGSCSLLTTIRKEFGREKGGGRNFGMEK